MITSRRGGFEIFIGAAASGKRNASQPLSLRYRLASAEILNGSINILTFDNSELEFRFVGDKHAILRAAKGLPTRPK